MTLDARRGSIAREEASHPRDARRGGTQDPPGDGMVHVSQLSRTTRYTAAEDIGAAFPLGSPIYVKVHFIKDGERVELNAKDVDQRTGAALEPEHRRGN